MKKLKFFLPLFVLFLFSCSKVENVDEGFIKYESLPSSSSVINPFEYIGISHNAKMDFISTMEDFSNSTLEDRFYFGQQYSDTYFNSAYSNYRDFLAFSEMCSDFANNIKSPAIVLLNEGIIDSEMSYYVVKLDSILTNAVDPVGLTVKSHSEFANEINWLEAQLMSKSYSFNPNTMQGDGTALLLGACAIAKYSYLYWAEASNDPMNPWHSILDGITSVKYTSSDTELEIRDMPQWLKKAWRAVKVAANDVWGFIAAEDCGDATKGGYNLGCAWDNAGNKSDSVP